MCLGLRPRQACGRPQLEWVVTYSTSVKERNAILSL
jgi:hypothetical protein